MIVTMMTIRPMAMPTNPRMMPVSHMPFAAGSFFLPMKPSTIAAIEKSRPK